LFEMSLPDFTRYEKMRLLCKGRANGLASRSIPEG